MSAAPRSTSSLCYNPNEVQPGPGSQDSRRLLQPIAGVNNMLQCDPRNRSTYHAGTLKLQQRFSDGTQFLVSYTYGKSLDYGGSAASGGGAVGNGQTITNMDAWHGPSGFDVRHRAVISYVYELPFGTGRRWMSDAGRPAAGPRRRLAAVGDHDDDDRPAVQRLAADRRQQRRPELAESDRLRQARQPDRRPLVQPRRLRRAAGEYLRRLGTRHPLRARATSISTRRCRSGSRSAGARMPSSGGMCSTCSITPASGFPNSRDWQPDSAAASRRPSSTTAACSSR